MMQFESRQLEATSGSRSVLLALASLVTVLFSRSRRRPVRAGRARRRDRRRVARDQRHAPPADPVALSCVIAAVAGAYYTQYYFFVGPEQAFGSAVSVEAIVPAVIGGIGTIWGPVIGAAGRRARSRS